MTTRVIIVDDANQQVIAPGTVFYRVTATYNVNDPQFNAVITKKDVKDSADWNAVGQYLQNGLPANTTNVGIERLTA